MQLRLRLGALLLFALPTFAATPLARAEDEVAIRLTDVTEAAALAGAKGDRFSFGDYDGDGDPDLLIQGRTLWRNDTKRFGKTDAAVRFTNVTKESGIAKGAGGGACWVDLDGNGHLDVVTTGGAVKLQLDEGQFEDHAAEWGLKLEKAATSLAVLDVDGDGRHDVVFGGGEDWNDGNAVFYPRVVLRNVQGARFEETSEDHALAGGQYGRAAVQADYDLDGDLDLYLGNYRLRPNELLANEDGRLVQSPRTKDVAGKESYDRAVLPDGNRVGYQWGHTIAAAWADLDADGDLDLWVSNLVHKFAGDYQGRYDVRGWICDDSAIYRNDGPPGWSFTDMRGESGIPLKPTGDRDVFRGDELWSNAACGDLDGDGLPEVFVTQVYKLPYSHSLLFHNRGGFAFEEISDDVGVRRFDSYGGAFADVDGDGDVDLVTNGRGSPEGAREVKLYRNDTEPGPWLAFRLEGRDGDRMPIGAQVTVVCEDGQLVRQVEGAMGSHAQQNEAVLRFGLRGRTAKEVLVRWPGGVLERLDVPKLGRVHVVKRPSKRRAGSLKLAPPEATDDGWRLKAYVRAKAIWVWAFDLDGDGNFETVREPSSREAAEATVEDPSVREVRVRAWLRGSRVIREGVWRLRPRD